MTWRTLLVSLVAGGLCAACGSNQNAGGAGGGERQRETLAGAADTTRKPKDAAREVGGDVRVPAAPAARPDHVAGAAATGGGEAPAGGAAAAADVSDMPLAPKDAQWTVFCASLGGSQHVELSKVLKKKLIQDTGMREWYIVHEPERSLIYYGFYRSINDPADAAETKRAQADRKKIDEWVDRAGERPFAACHFVRLSAPDPESPPEWNLTTLPEDKVWTLMVAAYKDHPDRKRAAVESVRAARAAGEEAYYYHGPVVSNVFIGAWPEEAVVEERVDNNEGVNIQRDPILVLPPGVGAPGPIRSKDGAVRAVGQRFVPVDEGMIRKMQQYPVMGVNGEELVYVDRKTGKRQAEGSKIVAIPRASETLFRENAVPWAQAQRRGNRGAGGPGGDDADFGGRRNPFAEADPYAGDPGFTNPTGPSPAAAGDDEAPPVPQPRRTTRSPGGLRSIEDR
jgi:hypothetical protein